MQKHTKKTPNPKSSMHPSIHPSLQGAFSFALSCDQERGGGEEERNVFAQAGAACRILGLILGC